MVNWEGLVMGKKWREVRMLSLKGVESWSEA
jgi:hypothetical protein